MKVGAKLEKMALKFGWSGPGLTSNGWKGCKWLRKWRTSLGLIRGVNGWTNAQPIRPIGRNGWESFKYDINLSKTGRSWSRISKKGGHESRCNMVGLDGKKGYVT